MLRLSKKLLFAIEAVLDTVVGRVLDQLGLPNQLMPRWGEGTGEPR